MRCCDVPFGGDKHLAAAGRCLCGFKTPELKLDHPGWGAIHRWRGGRCGGDVRTRRHLARHDRGAVATIDAAGFENRQRCLEGGAFDCRQRRGGGRQAGDGEANRCQNFFHGVFGLYRTYLG